ncbi:MAG: Tim44 domain-containing protein, partial [Methylocapsa sp.]|nr:Tim44 domain-containing protein [Methylocapsa sp.]
MAFRQRALIAALAAALALGAGGEAFARAGGGFSLGSRGARTFSMPSPTPTAPRVSPFDRSATQNGAISGGPARGGMFAGSFGRGLLGGFLGAGLFGLLFGHGLFGGLGGGLSFLGLILQLSLLYLLFKFVIGFVRGNGPAFQDAGLFGRSGLGFGQGGFGSRGFGGPGGQAGPFSQAKFEPSSQDFAAFEQRLAEVQSAFGAEDVERLRLLATPEMVSYFAGELADNAGRGLVNRISG